MNDLIKIRGARVHNLKNVDLDLPLNQIICFMGPSGSGKTSLAFHTLLAESKRRFLNSFPNHMKFFSDKPAPVDVDEISPVLPVFGLPQINPIVGSRATAADQLRFTELSQSLFYRFAKPVCPKHKIELEDHNLEKLIEQHLLEFSKKYTENKFRIFITKSEFLRIFPDGPFPTKCLLDDFKLDNFETNSSLWEILRVTSQQSGKLAGFILSHQLSTADIYLYVQDGVVEKLNLKISLKCNLCDYSISPIKYSTSDFSPFNALGACKKCQGYGATLEWDENKLLDKEKSFNQEAIRFLEYKPFFHMKDELKKILKKHKIDLDLPLKKLPKEFWKILYEGSGSYEGFNLLFQYLESKRYKPNVRIYIRSIQKEVECPECLGARLKKDILCFALICQKKNNIMFGDLIGESISGAKLKLSEFYSEDKLINRTIQKILEILEVSEQIGIGHLKLLRKLKSVSPGEYQRLLLAKYLSFEGTGALFVFDEPSLGLGELEQKMMLQAFKKLKQQNNTILLVDHSEYLQKSSDYLVELGPAAGHRGGEIIYAGLVKNYQFKTKPIFKLAESIINIKSFIKVSKAQAWGQKYDSFQIPVGQVTYVKGDSGTGKTTCISRIMANNVNYQITGEALFDDLAVSGDVDFKLDDIHAVAVIASDLNRFSSRSTVGSLTELSSIVKKHFAQLPVSRAMGLVDGHFSSNSELGMCPKCEGRGFLTVEMQYMEDIILTCEDCEGMKLKPIYAKIDDGFMNVHQAYTWPLHQVIERIRLTPKFRNIVEMMKVLNLDYLSLDRSISSLSGGEKQRIYLMSKLLSQSEATLFILENVSFGLSNADLERMMQFLLNLGKYSHTIVVIDQNKSLQSCANHVLHFGKDGRII
jgi:excinuclease ABC subunit A